MKRLILAVFVLGLLGAAPWWLPGGAMVGPAFAEAQPGAGPLGAFSRAWRDDPIWHDGQAEVAVYDATRLVYGVERRYQARLYTNKELASPQTKTKSADGTGREVFKHHLRQDIPTEDYVYHYSTMCYVGTADLKSLKLDMGSQEDCGASFKQFVNHAGTLQWRQFSYFPGEGEGGGSYAAPADLAYQDALSLILRGYRFERPEPMELALLPGQTSTRFSATEPRRALVTYLGLERLELPVGPVEAHHLRVAVAAAPGQVMEPAVDDYWFDADPRPPRLHVMVRHDGPEGRSLQLREHGRRAYWQR